MSIYTCYVRTAHGSIRQYQIVAASEEAAKREASEYGRVTLCVRVRGVSVMGMPA